ncbi:MAG TPA: hypothetical protein DHW02_12270 [Ktedonobacter sp.]|nr:hypothetical protein [Ktedonobacter sp.]
MAANTTDIIAGVFSDEGQAQRALDGLRGAGFGYDQIGVATQARRNVNLLDDFLNLDVSRDRASYYDQQYRNGNTVVSVRPDDQGQAQNALNILRSNGGYDYDQQSSGITGTTSTQATQTAQPVQTGTTNMVQNTANTVNTVNTTNTANTVQDEFYQPRTLRLREEQLGVNKERTQVGEVRLGKDVVEEQKTVNVPVTHEEVYVERRPVTGADAVADNTPIGTDETIRVPVSEEKVNVNKDTVVTGEVAVGKRAVQETQQVSDTVKREELRAEERGDAPIHGTQSDYLHPDSTQNDPANLDVEQEQ